MTDEQSLVEEALDAERATTVAEAALRSQLAAVETAKKDASKLGTQLTRKRRQTEEQNTLRRRFQNDNASLEAELRRLEEELRAERSATQRQERLRDGALARLATAETAAQEADARCLATGVEAAMAEQAVAEARRAADGESDQAADARRELDSHTKAGARAATAVQWQAGALMLAERSYASLLAEAAASRADAAAHAGRTETLHSALRAVMADASASVVSRSGACDAICGAERSVSRLRTILANAQAAVRSAQRELTAVCADRNAQGHALVLALQHLAAARARAHALASQTLRARGEAGATGEALLRELLQHALLEREQDGAREALVRAQARGEELHTAVQHQRDEALRLEAAVACGEAAILRQRKALAAVLEDRNQLSIRLQSRLSQAASAFEALKTHHCALLAAERSRVEALARLSNLSAQLADASRDLAAARRVCMGIDELQRDVHTHGRRLMAERAELASLSVEASTPINVHRWRMTSSADALALRQDNAALQRLLIQRTSELSASREEMEAAEAQRASLQKQVARVSPYAEASAQLEACRCNLREKARTSAALAAETASLRAAFLASKSLS